MHNKGPTAAVAVTAFGVGVQYALAATELNIWHRMAVAYVILIPLTLVLAPSTSLRAGALYKWRNKHAVAGIVAAVIMLAVTFAGIGLIRALKIGDLEDQIDGLMAWKSVVPTWEMWPLLVWIIVGEEVVWRGGVTLGLAKLGFWPAVLLGAVAFMLFHLAFGPPLLLIAALLAGAVWSALVLRSKNVWPPLICHLAWDVTVMLVL